MSGLAVWSGVMEPRLPAPAPPSLPELKGLRVLVVDDDHQIRAWVRRILEFNGYHVEVAGDGKEALAYLK